jgi:copper(I)-binding protein
MMKKRIFTGLVLLALLATLGIATACAQNPQGRGGSGLEIEDGWARAVPIVDGNSAFYFTVRNNKAEPDRLIGVETALGIAEMHESVVEGGVARMLPRPEGFEVPAGGALVLDQGGKHIMVMGVTEPLGAGVNISATLLFEGAGAIPVILPVQTGPTE